MPGFNGRGPMGEGSMTGRGRGRCANKNSQRSNSQREQDDITTGGFGLRRWLRRGNNQWRGFQQDKG